MYTSKHRLLCVIHVWFDNYFTIEYRNYSTRKMLFLFKSIKKNNRLSKIGQSRLTGMWYDIMLFLDPFWQHCYIVINYSVINKRITSRRVYRKLNDATFRDYSNDKTLRSKATLLFNLFRMFTLYSVETYLDNKF